MTSYQSQEHHTEHHFVTFSPTFCVPQTCDISQALVPKQDGWEVYQWYLPALGIYDSVTQFSDSENPPWPSMELITLSLTPNRDELPWYGTKKMPNEDKSKFSTKFSEKPLRKCHRQLCRNEERRKLMSLTCQVPWPPMATRWVALLGGTDLLYLLPRIYFWERPRRKDFEGLMWFRREAQVQLETPRDSRQTHKETAEWQGLVDTISLILGDSDPLLPIFPG